MHRQICWRDRQEDGAWRAIRVTVSRGRVKWQFKLSTEEKWDYTSPPSVSDWAELLQRMENRYQRRNATYDDLEFVRRQHEAAVSAACPRSLPLGTRGRQRFNRS